MTKLVIAIDGPVGSGKSTVARRVAELLGYIYVDTGAMYRAVAFKALRHGLALDGHDEELVALARATRIDLRAEDGTQRVLLDGEDVTKRFARRKFRKPLQSCGESRSAPSAGGRAAPRRRAGRRGDGRARHRQRGVSRCAAENFSYCFAGNARGAALARAPAEGRRISICNARWKKFTNATGATASGPPRRWCAPRMRWWWTARRWNRKKWRVWWCC